MEKAECLFSILSVVCLARARRLWRDNWSALSLGVDVILENGFWSRSERDDFRARATALGAGTKVHFLDVPRSELLRRLALRNAAVPADTFHITGSTLIYGRAGLSRRRRMS